MGQCDGEDVADLISSVLADVTADVLLLGLSSTGAYNGRW